MKSTALLSVAYWYSSYTLGLLLHPYKTAREIVRGGVFVPLLFAPAVYWGVVWAGAFVGVRLGDLLLEGVGVEMAPLWLVRLAAFLFWWVMWFLGLWQVELLYLWVRFRGVGGRGKR